MKKRPPGNLAVFLYVARKKHDVDAQLLDHFALPYFDALFSC